MFFMTVYVDVLVIINLLVNYFMLRACGLISRVTVTRKRLLLGALLGGLSSVLMLWDFPAVTAVLKILCAFLMVLLAFGFPSRRLYFRLVFCLFAVCFLFGGLMFAIYMLFDTDVLLYSMGTVYFDVSLTFLLLCTVISYTVITLGARILKKKAPEKKEFFITLEGFGESISCKALMDTGNSLTEPFSGYPVILADPEIFEKFYIKAPLPRQRIVPVTTVNGEGIIRAFRPDSLTLEGLKTQRVYVAESREALDEYKIILNINFEGEMQNEKA